MNARVQAFEERRAAALGRQAEGQREAAAEQDFEVRARAFLNEGEVSSRDAAGMKRLREDIIAGTVKIVSDEHLVRARMAGLVKSPA